MERSDGRQQTGTALPGTPAALRYRNSRAVLSALLADDTSSTVSDLAALVGLSRPTVDGALADLVVEGWVAPVDPVPTPNRPGRRARRFVADAAAGSVIGVELGLHGVVGVLADLRGRTLRRVERTAPSLARADDAWPTIQQVAAALTADGAPPVLAATWGVPAIVDRDGRITASVAAPDWVAGDLPSRLPALFPDAITVFDNDAKLAATAEATWGALREVADGVHLVMGRQIGAALVVDGRVARGVHGGAGEIGGIASSGWAGASERFVAALPSGAGLHSVLESAREGRPAAVTVVTSFARDVATGVAQLVAAIDPELVVVGGEVVPAAGVFGPALAAAVAELTGSSVAVAPSALGPDAVALGAVARSLAAVHSGPMGLDMLEHHLV